MSMLINGNALNHVYVDVGFNVTVDFDIHVNVIISFAQLERAYLKERLNSIFVAWSFEIIIHSNFTAVSY